MNRRQMIARSLAAVAFGAACPPSAPAKVATSGDGESLKMIRFSLEEPLGKDGAAARVISKSPGLEVTPLVRVSDLTGCFWGGSAGTIGYAVLTKAGWEVIFGPVVRE